MEDRLHRALRLPPDVSADVAALCRRCLAPTPEERFASCGELAAALRGLALV